MPTEVTFACAAVCRVPVKLVEVNALNPVIVVDKATSSALTVMFEPAMTLRVFPLFVIPAPAVIWPAPEN